ncbi:MAG: hypothetical protein KKB70_07260 [Proteobacteria bacterium]|nr:hypothetical protein [Pseudomonadota bacterium]MBU1612601.1 hypothetical protein [Pseudomonadota bacterium]
MTHSLDILEMPFDALAAYWLSLKKLTDAKKGKGVLAEEATGTEEPFIRHLLEVVFSGLEISVVRRLAEVRRDELLHAYQQKIEIMRLALFAIASSENPRVTLVRMNSKYAEPPMEEKQAFEMARAMGDALADPSTDKAILLDVDHKMTPDRLLVKLMFYVIHARHKGKTELAPFLKFAGSPYFTEGLALCIDGFEADFLAYHLESIRDETLRLIRLKMDMSLEMALSIRKKYSYDDIWRVARSFMP